MLIDEIIYDVSVAHKKIVRRGSAMVLPPGEAETQIKALSEQLSALDALTPRYKADNIYAPLNPKLLHVDTEVAKKGTRLRWRIATKSLRWLVRLP